MSYLICCKISIWKEWQKKKIHFSIWSLHSWTGCSPVLSDLPPSSPLHPTPGVTFQQISPSILQDFCNIFSLVILWQQNRFFSFLHMSHPTQWGRARLSLGAGGACGDPMDGSGLLESKFGFHFSLISIFFPGLYSILRQSSALIFITLGSSLSYKPANFQSHLLTYTEIQAGHKNSLGNLSKQWYSFLVAAK